MKGPEASGEAVAIALLFSDIEGSTRRWERHGKEMRLALRRHDEIVRSAIERNGGHVFKTIGDAFCASFASVADALAAAVEGQRALQTADFSAVGGLEVRMAIHEGGADARDGDFFGPSVNRTARLLAAGNGGQILLSAAAAERARGALSGDVALHELGRLALRDIAEPENVYQAVAADLRASLKPLRGLQTPPNNLPHRATSFVGRRDDVDRLEALLRTDRLVTIVGAGGLGKTRLAVEASANVLNDYADGVWFVDLAAISDPQMVAGAVLSTLGVAHSDRRASIDVLLEYLNERRLLLILDNCEHVVSGVVATAAAILRECPGVTQLATSREALDASGERLYRLTSLELDAAVQLFDERARMVDPTFRLENERAAVREICSRLDGMALAVELAAARLRTMRADVLLRRLNPSLLVGARDKQPRQQTMEALIGWSYDLLDAGERTFLRACAVFAGGFVIEHAAAVGLDEPPDEARSFATVSSLVEKSLVLYDARVDRYRMLEPIREFLLARLRASDDATHAHRRHARAFAAFTAIAYGQWERGPDAEWLARASAEIHNVRAALIWSLDEKQEPATGARLAADAVPIFLRLARLVEGVRWCETVIAAGIELTFAVEARLRYGLSSLYTNLGSNKLVLPQAQAAVALYRQAGDLYGVTRALSQCAHHLARQLQYEQARAAAAESLELARSIGDAHLLAATLQRCASAYEDLGIEPVRECHAESVALFRALGRDQETARALTWWGQSEAETGNFTQAVRRLLEARAIAGEDLAASLLTDIVGCYLAMGETNKARPLAYDALMQMWSARHPIGTPMSVLYCAAIAAPDRLADAARLAGYAEHRLAEADWSLVPPDSVVAERLHKRLRRVLSKLELARLQSEGATWSDERAVAAAAGAIGETLP